MRNTEDKERAYALVVEQGFTATAAARELGIPRSTVCGWASDGHWAEIRGELCRDELRAKMKTAETELGDDSADVRETSMRILHGINLWLQMNGVVQPRRRPHSPPRSIRSTPSATATAKTPSPG